MSSKKVKRAEEIGLPKGFRASGIAAGLKGGGEKDMALIVSDTPAVMAGAFTTNQVKAAPVKLDRKRLAGRTGRAIIVNSGNANACNGAQGMRDAERMAELTAELIGADERHVFVCSTGRIGVGLPMDLVEAGIRKAAEHLSRDGAADASKAIMTTDTKPKRTVVTLAVDKKPVIIAAFAKGAGMIEPKMATMLAFILTDAVVDPDALQTCVSEAVDHSFNRITVDADRSTNDTVLCMANGAADNRPVKRNHADWPAFCEGIRTVTMSLALKMVEDGEGATKLVTVRVRGARNDAEADFAARSVANSLLVKTSWAGEYPNWGRIMDALGYSEAKVNEERVEIRYDGLMAAKDGVFAGASIENLKRVQRQKAFTIEIDLRLGRGAAVVYTCNLTEDYVRINR